MSAAATYATLRRLSSSVVTTEEASAALRTSSSTASRALRNLEAQGLVRGVRHGLWSVAASSIDPRSIVAELTRPFPAYVSFQSALAAHRAIDQIPREIAVASLGKARKIETALATYAIHRLPPELFGGFVEREGVMLATVEKAIFDFCYVACASGALDRRLPELDLPAEFRQKRMDEWTRRIRSTRLRTRVKAAITRVLARADYEDA